MERIAKDSRSLYDFFPSEGQLGVAALLVVLVGVAALVVLPDVVVRDASLTVLPPLVETVYSSLFAARRAMEEVAFGFEGVGLTFVALLAAILLIGWRWAAEQRESRHGD